LPRPVRPTSFRPVPLAAALLGWALLTPLARPDWVTMKDGRRERHLVMSRSGGWVRLQSPGGELALQDSAILDIEMESAADNAVLRAEYAFKGSSKKGRALLEALKLYDAARLEGATVLNLSTSLTPVLKHVVAPENTVSVLETQSLTDLLRALAAEPIEGASSDFLYYASLLLARNGPMRDAMAMFSQIPKTYFDDYPSRRRALGDLVAADVSDLLDEGDLAGALERIEALHSLDAERGRSGEAIIHLSRASIARKDGRFDEAMAIYAEKLGPEFPEIAKDRTWAALKEAASQARRAGRFQPVVDLCRKARQGVLGPVAVDEMLGEVYRDWGLWRLDRNDFDGAREALGEYYRLIPDENETLLDLAEYRRRRAQSDPDAAEQRYLLGKFCLEAGLYDLAAEEFQRARQDRDWQELADKRLADIETHRLENILFQALEMKKEDRFVEALENIDHVLKRASDPELRADALRIAELAKNGLLHAELQRPKEAQVLWQNASRCNLPGEIETCLDLLTRIVREYPETSWAEKALRRRRELLSRSAAKLEHRPRAAPAPEADLEPVIAGQSCPHVRAADLRREMRQIQKALEASNAP
jgi:tetratricopeptide (TPR) repeat protein